MSWEVEASDEFKEWYESLREEERASVAENVDMLEEYDDTQMEGDTWSVLEGARSAYQAAGK